MTVYNIPTGTLNLSSLFPSVNFSGVEEYYVEALDQDAGVVATTCLYKMLGDCDDRFRLHFLNRLGTIDAITFNLQVTDHESKSDSYQVPNKYPQQKSLHSINRFNVRSNNTYTLSCIDYREEDMAWIEELLDSPVAWMEFAGTQGQPADFIPIVIQDKKFEEKKESDRYVYEVLIEVKLSHERKSIRN